MRPNNRKEALKMFLEVLDGVPMVVMTFKEPKIGVFYDAEALEKALNNKKIKQAYAVLNLVKPEVLKRLPRNEFGKMQKGCGVSKNDITAYRYLFIDIDVCGLERTDGKKRNATEAEHEHAKSVCMQVKDYLQSLNFPKPVIIDSGNGFHALWRVNLDVEHEKLIMEAIQSIGNKVNTGEAKVDCVVGDRARKIKLPGSANNLDEDNTRYSAIVELPKKMEKVTEEQLKRLVSKGTKDKTKKTWKGSPGDDEEDKDKGLIELVEKAGDYYMSDTRQVLADVHMSEDKAITMNTAGRDFKLFIRRKMKEELKVTVLKNDMWRSILDYIEVLASEEGKAVRTIYNRIGRLGDAIYYDLCDEDYQSIKITTEGYESVDTPPGVFQRTDLDKPQVEPDFDKKFDFWQILGKLFNLRTKQELELLGIWLICSFIPDIPKPLLLFSGAFSSGKSTACSMLQELISPVTVRRSSFPRKVDDFAVRLANSCLCSFDNCDRISVEASNLMCLSITGGSYEKRRLYTDSELITIPLKGMIIMNSCESILEKPDILSRTLQFNLQQIKMEELLDEESIEKIFEKYKPFLLDYIFITISESMMIPDEPIHYVTRMTDWQKVATKIAHVALDKDASYVEELLKMNQNDINITLIESNPVAVLVLKFMEKRVSWKGSVTELYDELDSVAFEEEIERSNRLYPRNASSLSMRLNSLAGILAQAGITFYIRPVGNYKEIQLKNNNLVKAKEQKKS